MPLSFGKDVRTVDARKNLSAAMGEFEAFFQPYDRLLAQIVHPEFAWSAETHTLSADKLQVQGGRGRGAARAARGGGRRAGAGRGARRGEARSKGGSERL